MKQKIKQALKFIEQCAKNQEIHLAFSGGKDSVVLYDLVKKVDIDTNAFYSNTTIDPPGTIRFIRDNFDVKIIHPKESFYQLVERKGLPTRLTRYCCELLKEQAGIGKHTFEGVRADESRERGERDYIVCDTRKWMKGAKHYYAIFDWTTKEVWKYTHDNKLPIAPCYKDGLERLGCVGCPLVAKHKREREFALYPRYYEAIKKAIGKGMVKNPQWKLSKLCNGYTDLAMRWWMSRKTMNEFFNIQIDQYKLFGVHPGEPEP